MKHVKKLILLSVITNLLLFSHCKEKQQTQGDPEIQTQVLGHRGSGSGYSNTFYENTFESIVNALKILDGVEIDIQMSKDGTLWVYHDSKVPICRDCNIICIPNATDNEINMYNQCIGTSKGICQLEEIFKYFHTNKLNKKISLDVKGYFEASCFEGRNANKQYQEALADKIIQLVCNYNLQKQVMVETDYLDVLDYIVRSEKIIECYILSYTNLQTAAKKALEHNYTGISFHYSDSSLTQNNITSLRENNLKLQVWTVNKESDLLEVYRLKPDYIQTDNMKFNFNALTDSI